MKIATKAKAELMGILSADKLLNFQVHHSNGETEATIWSLADPEQVTTQLNKEIFRITPNEQKRL
jgi:hypothetical protein